MRFLSRSDDFIKTLTEERLNKKLDKHIVIAEYRTRRICDFGLKDWVTCHVKMLDSGIIYTVSYIEVNTSKNDEIEEFEIEQIAPEEEMLEVLEEQYREFNKEAVEVNINDIRAKVIKKSSTETSIVLNFN